MTAARRGTQSYAARKATGRKPSVVWLDDATEAAIAVIMEARGYTVRRDAIAWAFTVAARVAAGERASGEVAT